MLGSVSFINRVFWITWWGSGALLIAQTLFNLDGCEMGNGRTLRTLHRGPPEGPGVFGGGPRSLALPPREEVVGVVIKITTTLSTKTQSPAIQQRPQ